MSEMDMKSDGNASLMPYVMRFTLVFVGMSIAALLITTWFSISGNAGLSVGILMASAVATGQKFITDHKRVFGGGEKLRMAFYCLLVSFVISVVLFVALMLVIGEDPQILVKELLHLMPVWVAVASLVFAGVLNFGMLYLSFGFLIRKIFEGMVKRGEIK